MEGGSNLGGSVSQSILISHIKPNGVVVSQKFTKFEVASSDGN